MKKECTRCNDLRKSPELHPGSRTILLAMKITTILLFVTCLQVGAKGYSQKVTLNERKGSFEKVLQQIEKQSGYVFWYEDRLLLKANPVDITVKNVPLEEVLETVFKDQPLGYEIIGKTIAIKEKQPAKAILELPPPPITITGRVLTKDGGKPLPGVTILIKGRVTGTVTNADGYFTLQVAKTDKALLFSCIGMKKQEVVINNRTEINVTMEEEVSALNELQIVGYGVTTKRLNTGSVSSINSVDLAKETITNPLTALQGHIAGMQITQDNGLPGGGVRVNIRGASSGFSQAGFVPLYVIDGVPFTLFNGGSPTSDNLNAYGTSGANGNLSPFSMINPEDIERIDVLKDGDATAIYGSRGSNGVVLITTKKGKRGKTVFNVNVYNGTGTVNHYIPMMNTQQYLAMRTAAFTNAGVTPTTANAKDLTVWDQKANTDWQKWAIGGTAHTTNATFSVSGGDEQNTFLFSSTYRKEGTVFPGDYNNTTFSSRLNAGHKTLNDKFSINLSINYAYMGNNLPSYDLSQLYNLPPNYPLNNADGTANWTLTNPASYFLKNYNGQTTNLISNLYLVYKLLPGLSLKANLGYSLTRLHQTSTNPASSQNPATASAATNRLTYTDNDNGNYIIEPQIEYLKTFGKGKLQALVGSTFQQNKSTGVYLNGVGYSNEALINSLLAASSITISYNNNSLYKYTALFGKVTYNWDNKYILDGTFRRDGSSRFGESNRFGNFGALGAAWLFSQEAFMKNINFLSYGKLRGSYGLTGNDQIMNYQYFAAYSVAGSSYSYQGSSVTYPSNIANPNLQWETTKKLDFALELGFLKDRVLLKTDYYRNRSSNELTYISVPSQTGTSSYLGNLPAVIQNKGMEFELNTINISSKDFKWTTSINLTINRNKLISYPGLATSSYSTSYFIGLPTDLVQLYHYTGVDPQTGLPTFKTVTGTPNYNTDRIKAPYGHPYYGGISNSLTYKNFTFDFTFQYVHRNGYLNNTLAMNYSPYGYTYTNQSTAILNRWTTIGDKAFYPAASTNSNSLYSTLASSDYNWGDASYFKFKTASLNYSVPKQWVNKLKLSEATIYLQGQNLFTWAKQKYTYDPETTQPGTGSGLGTGQYVALPQLRTIVIGLNVTF